TGTTARLRRRSGTPRPQARRIARPRSGPPAARPTRATRAPAPGSEVGLRRHAKIELRVRAPRRGQHLAPPASVEAPKVTVVAAVAHRPRQATAPSPHPGQCILVVKQRIRAPALQLRRRVAPADVA